MHGVGYSKYSGSEFYILQFKFSLFHALTEGVFHIFTPRRAVSILRCFAGKWCLLLQDDSNRFRDPQELLKKKESIRLYWRLHEIVANQNHGKRIWERSRRLRSSDWPQSSERSYRIDSSPTPNNLHEPKSVTLKMDTEHPFET